MLRSILKRFDCYLRNTSFPEPQTHKLEDLFDGKPDPLRTRAYWAVRRGFKRTIEFPGRTYRETKWFIQRGRRGWADCDVWSLDHYLDGWLPAALRRLKEIKHGLPTEMFDGLPVDESGNPGDTVYPIAEARWNEILDKMVAGFEASRRVCDGMYEEELGPYPIKKPEGMTPEGWEQHRENRFQKSQELTERDKKIFEEGMKFFAMYYWALWD